uniref:Store-operated calcium entry-associated regulatory factor n=1 Tax=Ganoderma boninense TaxID=34458 RepID=A0A5K1K8J2_9APHY|nr:N/A [Ganoderma boninense]
MDDPISFFFILLWIFVLGLIIYSAFKSCFASRPRTNSRPTPRPPPRTPGSGWFSGGGGGPQPDHHDAPPPYTKYPSGSGAADAGGWRPGFWSGAALGYLGNQLLNRRNEQQQQQQPGLFGRPQGMYDWEAPRSRSGPATSSSSWFGGGSSYGSSRRPGFDDDNRGEGPSNLGRMRRSTGLGGTNVR